MKLENAWKKYDETATKKIFDFNDGYKQFITRCKTERECVTEAAARAKAAGYMDLEEVTAKGMKLEAGDKVYAVNMGKNIALFQIGQEPIEKGMNILGAHIDSPRLDLKQNPLYEDTGLALLKTHYYGGIKKYQWVALPLALHGVVVKKDKTVIQVVIGEEPTEPVFCVSDLLVHLSDEQMEKRADKVIEAEDMNILIGSIPLAGQEKEPVKAMILKLLFEKYQIEEEDFVSAEFEAVPSGAARDYGLDGSMVMGYGHDDRVCAYPSLEAILSLQDNKRTAVCLLVDKEEIGSKGATGMESRFFENTVAEVMNCTGNYNELKLRRALKNSKVLSSDVTAAYDPNYPNVSEKNNCAYLGGGLTFNKYTGSRGKYNTNDANPEYIAELRNVMDEQQVTYQMTEFGKVDIGGSGTIAYILANYDMQVIDSGVGVLNMHAPWEIISKVDIYEAYMGYQAFLNHI